MITRRQFIESGAALLAAPLGLQPAQQRKIENVAQASKAHGLKRLAQSDAANNNLIADCNRFD